MPRLYIQVECDTFDHPKVLQIVEAFELPPDLGADLVVAMLTRWWSYCVKYGSDGRPAICPRTVLTGFARNVLGHSTKQPKPDIEQVLRDVRLVDRHGYPWDWEDYSGGLLTKRHKDAERKRTERGLSVDGPRNGARREEKSSRDSTLTLDLEGGSSSSNPEEQPKLSMLPARRGNTLADVQEHLRAVGEATRMHLLRRDARRLFAELIFSYWCKKLDHPKAMLDDDREGHITKALRGNYDDVSELLYVIDGAFTDEWAMSSPGRHDTDYLFRNRSTIEKYLTTAKYRNGEAHPVAVKYGISKGTNGTEPRP